MAKKKVATTTKKVTRKKKVKRKKATSDWANGDLSNMTSQFLRDTQEAARREYGDSNIVVGSEACRIIVGIPLPCLAMEYILQNDVLPLGRFAQIVGPPGTCKSALTCEIARWIKNLGGITYLFENETEFSPDFANSIIGYPEELSTEAYLHVPCRSVDDWQEKIQSIADKCRTKMSEPGVGRVFPVMLILDSLMGKLSEESQAKIDKLGYADRSHPVEALQINAFMKKFPQDIEEWPMFFAFVNHLKMKASEAGYGQERSLAGGKAPNFQETFELELKRDANANIRLVDDDGFEIGGLHLVLACKKNSLGETNRKIKVDIKWIHREDPATGEWRQHTKWDWPAATTKLLASFDKGHRAEKVAEIVDVKGSGDRWYSKTYGITSTAPVSAHDLGILIENDVNAKRDLRRLFGIKERKHFQPGVDYLQQLDEIKKSVRQKLNSGDLTEDE